MESEFSSPPKRFRKIVRKDISIPLIECKREFKLPQQFPSRVTYPKRLCNLTQPRSLINPPNRGMFMMNDVKKMQLQSKDGKDLGEIKLKLLPSNLVGKTIDYNNLDLKSKINKPVTLSFKCSKTSDKSSKLDDASLCIKNVPDNGEKYNLDDSERKLLKNSRTISKYSQNTNMDNNITDKNTFSNKIHCNKLYDTHVTSNINPKNSKIQKNKSVISLSTLNDGIIRKRRDSLSNTNKSILQKNTLEIPKTKINMQKKALMKDNMSESVILKISPLETSTTKVNITAGKAVMEIKSNTDISLKSKEHLSLIQSKFPVVKCEKLIISQNRVKIKELDDIADKTNSSKPNFSSVIENNQRPIDNNIDNGKTEIEVKKLEVQAIQDATVQSKSQISSVSKDIFYNKEIPNTKIVSCFKDSFCNTVESKNKDPCFENTNNNTNIDKEEPINEITQQKLSQHLDIITKALISVTDEKLRAKALKALEDCGIGVTKYVPISPPENLKAVHDSQIQTEVFGLLDLENFVLVKEDVPTLKRIKQTEQSTTTTITDLNIPSQPSIIQHNNFANQYFSSNNIFLPNADDLHDLDTYLLMEDQTTINNVKRNLDIPYPLFKKVSTQLKIDYESLHQWDNNGMLSIHRAVLDNDLQEVKRLLLVLKACKISIDVLTINEMTCLELAVQSEASVDMVQLLLDEGAKPISPEVAHESAIIIACKSSSPLLPVLIQHVTDRELLNTVDSTGMAPLHYCALNGNLIGVNALLKAEVDVNLKDNRSGRTAIFHALENNYVSIARKLLTHGAITSIKNFSGQSALTLVEETKNFSLKAALKQIIF